MKLRKLSILWVNSAMNSNKPFKKYPRQYTRRKLKVQLAPGYDGRLRNMTYFYMSCVQDTLIL
ncbi:MAG: hypothetical protein MJA30_35110 [Cytophagales bacterium]|nr:hypothetical protein [Cytophagales bacterium]